MVLHCQTHAGRHAVCAERVGAVPFLLTDENNEIIGMTLFHVDDFLLAGRPTDPRWQKAQETLHACWQWGDWEVEKFKICGVAVEQASDGTVALSQKQYIRSLIPIELSQQRRQQSESVLNAHELTQVRGLLGALQWVASQTVAKISAELGILQSRVATPTVLLALDANRLLRRLRQDQEVDLISRRMDEPVCVVCWSDAAWANRPDGSSAGGSLVAVCERETLLQGDLSPVHVVDWHSTKLKRKSRSSNAAEVQALNDAEDRLWWRRLLRLSFVGQVHGKDRDQSVTAITGVLVTDSRSNYDALHSESGGLGLEERRTALELSDVKERIVSSQVVVRWVNAAANLADSLTKASARLPLMLLCRDFMWAATRDALQRSARKRQQLGLDPLEGD